MSWVPLVNSWGVGLFVASAFLAWSVGFDIFVICITFSLFFLVKEVVFVEYHYGWGFMLFIVMEAFTFATLFAIAVYVEYYNERILISDFIEFPFLGCFALLGSSIFITVFHHCYGMNYSVWLLLLTILLGLGFILIQLVEFDESPAYLDTNAYSTVAFATVGLHFTHVFGGLVVLSSILYVGYLTLEEFYVDVAVWYWHFVDYIWLWVYFIFYLPRRNDEFYMTHFMYRWELYN